MLDEVVEVSAMFLQKRESRLEELRARGIHTNVESLAAESAQTYDLPGHTVTIADVDDGDFVGRTGLMLGVNQVR